MRLTLTGNRQSSKRGHSPQLLSSGSAGTGPGGRTRRTRPPKSVATECPFRTNKNWCQRHIFNCWPRALPQGLPSAVQISAVPLTEKEGIAISVHLATIQIAYEERWIAYDSHLADLSTLEGLTATSTQNVSPCYYSNVECSNILSYRYTFESRSIHRQSALVMDGAALRVLEQQRAFGSGKSALRRWRWRGPDKRCAQAAFKVERARKALQVPDCGTSRRAVRRLSLSA